MHKIVINVRKAASLLIIWFYTRLFFSFTLTLTHKAMCIFHSHHTLHKWNNLHDTIAQQCLRTFIGSHHITWWLKPAGYSSCTRVGRCAHAKCAAVRIYPCAANNTLHINHSFSAQHHGLPFVGARATAGKLHTTFVRSHRRRSRPFRCVCYKHC